MKMKKRQRKAESVEVERRKLETEKVWKCEKKGRGAAQETRVEEVRNCLTEEALPLWSLWMWLSRFNVSLFHVCELCLWLWTTAKLVN